jgi:hypothetical protein
MIESEGHNSVLRIRIVLLQPVTSIDVTDNYLFAVLLQALYDHVLPPPQAKGRILPLLYGGGTTAAL